MNIRTKAKLDNFTLDMETIDDTVEKEIAKYEFPYVDGAKLDDMGAHARAITFRCHFIGEDYDRHKDFFKYVSARNDNLYKLTHPVYGLMEGKIEKVHVVKTFDVVDDAPVDITFVQELHDDLGTTPVSVNVVSNLLEDAFQLGQLEQMAAVAADLFDTIGSEANDIINAVLDPAKTLVDSFVNASLSAREVLSVIDGAIAKAGAILSSTTIPTNELVSIVEYPLTLPGRLVQTFAQAASRQAQSLLGVAAVPAHYIQALLSSFASTNDQFSNDSFPMAKHAAIACAQQCALQAAYRYDEDEQRRLVLKSSEGLPSFDMAGRFLNPPQAEPIMTIDELESTLALIRQSLQDAIEKKIVVGGQTIILWTARDMTSLKTMAASLLQHVSSVKLQRESIVTKVYTSEMPLHIICVRENLPYNYAERICSINPKIQNPSFVSGEVDVYAG